MEVTRTFDLLKRGKNVYADSPALGCKVNGQWIEYSIDQYIEFSNYLSYAFLSLGLKKGDKIATITNNRPEWNFVDMGSSQAGLVHVPIYPTISDEEYEHILSHSDTRIVFVSDRGLYNRVKPIAEKTPNIIGCYSFNAIEGIPNWQELVEKGKTEAKNQKSKLEALQSSIKPDDLVSIIYTSGTTGLSKGVMLSHKNFLSNVEAILHKFDIDNKDIALSFLPLSHVYERLVGYYYQYMGVSIYYAENMGAIADNLREIKPTIFVSVPRVIEKTYDKILSTGRDLKGIKKAIFFWAVHLGYKYKEEGNNSYYMLRLKLARKLIFSKWAEALGGNLKFIISGGASLQPRLARVFFAAGIPIYEGYGLTETSPVIAVNSPIPPNSIMFGTVGPIVNNIQVKFADDGEILMKGDSLMMGYYNAPEATAEAIDEEGWFHTGDIGELSKDKFLMITDRKKEIFKLSNGKYVAPQMIENKLKGSFFIEQAMVVGENEKFVSALISPNFMFLHNWCARYKIHYENNRELVLIPEVIARIQKEVNEVNKTLGSHEKIKRIRVVSDQWNTSTGELSPTLKLRRRVIYKRYDPILQEIYGYVKEQEVRGLMNDE